MSEDWNRNAQRTHRRQFLAGVGMAATAGSLRLPGSLQSANMWN
ncbi:MAG: hypothetical protein VXY78_07235 [Pseudomonadota bacterium]|nr:hypothetical protein [Pseudomonadota bacterium]MEC7604943.1 hypothetical protein [Pseudomonadota bacterium]MEC8588158.1 hypothetical protein [Pseudomonadota bacterium]MEC8804132.1 hypothetical protein [Pseudomonadota bacterium]MEC9191338.1 hypothetical protein [Pseudomonadota bacterium]